MTQRPYAVYDLQQRAELASVGHRNHANTTLNIAKTYVADGHRIIFCI